MFRAATSILIAAVLAGCHADVKAPQTTPTVTLDQKAVSRAHRSPSLTFYQSAAVLRAVGLAGDAEGEAAAPSAPGAAIAAELDIDAAQTEPAMTDSMPSDADSTGQAPTEATDEEIEQWIDGSPAPTNPTAPQAQPTE